MGGYHNTLMTTLFTKNYLHEIPNDLQIDIMNYSKSRWRIYCSHLDNDKFSSYMLNMIKKDMSLSDTTKHDTIIELQKKLSFSNVSYQFANQKLSEAINDVIKYQDEFDFDLYELLSKITIEEHNLYPSHTMCRIYDWNLNEYVTNPDYKPDKDWEYSSDEDE